jgi:HlyD family secretion protein
MDVATEDNRAFHNTQGQDRVLAPRRFVARHRGLLIIAGVITVGLIGLLGSIFYFTLAPESVERSRVTVSKVERGTFVRDIAAEGQIVAAASPTLYAPAAGIVTLRVHAGDAVTSGQVLAVIDAQDLSAKRSQEEALLQSMSMDWKRSQLQAQRGLAQVRAILTQAELDLKVAERESDRTRKAYEAGAYSELQYLRTQDAVEKARFGYEQAKKDYESQPEQNRFDVGNKKALLDRQQLLVDDLKRQIEALEIRSPVTGQVGQVQVADRASVSRDTPLLTTVDLSSLEVEIKVPESLARDLAAGIMADLEGGGRRFKAVVSGVSPQVVNGDVTARLRFEGEKPAGLRQNQRLSVRIFVDKRDHVLMVDRGLFVDQDGGGAVYVVHGQIAERRPVRLGAAGVEKVEILEGVAEGDEIVTSGADAFRGAPRVTLRD